MLDLGLSLFSKYISLYICTIILIIGMTVVPIEEEILRCSQGKGEPDRCQRDIKERLME